MPPPSPPERPLSPVLSEPPPMRSLPSPPAAPSPPAPPSPPAAPSPPASLMPAPLPASPPEDFSLPAAATSPPGEFSLPSAATSPPRSRLLKAGSASPEGQSCSPSEDALRPPPMSESAEAQMSETPSSTQAAPLAPVPSSVEIQESDADADASCSEDVSAAADMGDAEARPPSPSEPPSTAPDASAAEPECAQCMSLAAENDTLLRKVARLRQRLRDAVETAQTHGQRLLRAAYQDKVRELTVEHTHKTTEMLNMQKKCFEDELEAVDSEAQAAVAAMQRERDAERAARVAAEERFRREREAALEKTSATMVAVQRKMAQLHARATRLEREKKALAAAVGEKQVMIEVVASAAAAKDVERRRVDVLAKTQEEERKRKDKLVEALQAEVGLLREKLGQERQVNVNLVAQIETMEGERKEDHERHAEDLDDCKQQSKKEVDRLGRLFASVMQDFANVQSDVSTND